METQKTLVEAAGASQYGWHAARHMEAKKGFFSIDDKDNLAKLQVCEGYVRRDCREENFRNKNRRSNKAPYQRANSNNK